MTGSGQVQCEMCGTETGSPKTVKIEGAELDVCDDCADFGTEVQTQEELANQLNEKASLIRKLERGDVLPSDTVQRKLEKALGISLSTGGGGDDSEWSSDSATGGTTLGDVVKRKD